MKLSLRKRLSRKCIFQCISSRLFFFVMCVVIVAVTLTSQQRCPQVQVQYITVQPPIVLTRESGALYLKCQNVLDKMVKGSWNKNAHTQVKLDELHDFLNRTRMIVKMPPSLQREDKKCGNVNFEGLKWTRAVCNPNGKEPCCYDNQCVSRSEEECRCLNCYDLRQQIHAELATWVPSDPTCQMTHFSGEEDACKVLHNMTIYFMGDSFMRQVYISFLSLIRSNTEHGAVRETATPEEQKTCDKYFRYYSECSGTIIRDSLECNKTVRVKLEVYWKASHGRSILNVIRGLIGKPNSVIVLGLGVHDNFNMDELSKQIFDPMFELLSNLPWPKLVWMAAHAPGILKTSLQSKQQSESVLKFNAEVKAMMDKRGIPILDFYQLTNGTMSYDGGHYGKGVNDVKTQIFLNYLLEIRTHSALFSPISLYRKQV